MIVNRLKETTIKRYDARQLRRHLDRFMTYFEPAWFGAAPYRIDQYQVYYHNGFISDDHAYTPYCNLNDRDALVAAIRDCYRQVFPIPF
jgi:hypothetical protein